MRKAGKTNCRFFWIFIFAWLFLAIKIDLFAQGSQQIDPFYLNLLEKAQKTFLSKNYTEAIRQLEIAAFGLAGEKVLKVKAYVYLSLSHYYLRNMKESEKYLKEAADLVGEKEFENLQIAESAWPDLEKLLISFNIREAPKEAPPQVPATVDKPVKAKREEPKKREQKAPQKTAEKPPEKPSEQPLAADKPLQPATAQGKPPDADTTPPIKLEDKATQEPAQPPQSTLDNIKEGDLVPLEMVEIPPAVLKRVHADYPTAARSFGIEGTVIVNALISEKGDVIKTEVIKGIKSSFGFNLSAQNAVRQWKFEPAVIKGLKVKVWMPIAIVFKAK